MGRPAGEGEMPELGEVGRTIRRLRRDRGLSMAVVAERAGLSQPFISQLESGAHTPSLLTLYRISAALDVLPGELFGDSAPLTGWVRHQPARISASETPHAPVATVLVPGGGGGLLEAYEWEVSDRDDSQAWWQHEGEDLIYVITGQVLLEVQGTDPLLLSSGQSGHLVETHKPHRWAPANDLPARVVLVVANPSRA